MTVRVEIKDINTRMRLVLKKSRDLGGRSGAMLGVVSLPLSLWK
jgi:hypothetical protein